MDENRTPRESRSSQPARRRRRRRTSLMGALLYVVFVIGVSILLATFGWTLANDVLALNKVEHSAVITLPSDIFETREVEEKTKNEDGETVKETKVVKEADVDYVAEQLQENGIIEHKWLFKLFASVTNSDRKMQPGTYTLDTNMDYRAIVTNLGSTSANRATVSVTFVEGSTIDQVFALMEEKGVCTVAELQNMAATHDYAFSFLQDIPLGDYHRLEGYLFPDTYTFYMNEDAKTAINKMLVNFDAKFTEEMREQVAQSDYSIRDILIIASLIEKETDGEDQKTIASVIYNRLNNTSETGGKLQIDATLAYINGGKVPTEADKEIDSPYNTYLYAGLPAGPIANPGMAAIRAAMNPEETGYYYYVLNPETNRHEYSKTYNEHVNKVNQYYGGQ
ncbi:MAG: endolytic transglycosylase MltG [Oscillospiraceae bacterium]